MVTGPMPRKPKATRPKANTAGAFMKPMAGNSRLTRYATPMRMMMEMPIQNALKLPATRPERMLSEAPPSREEVSTSRTWAEFIEVKTLTSSGMTAPANVPQLMMIESFHHNDGSPARLGISSHEKRKVSAIETIEVIHTSQVSGCSKFIFSAWAYLPRWIAALARYDPPEAMIIMIRMAKIQTSRFTCTALAAFA